MKASPKSKKSLGGKKKSSGKVTVKGYGRKGRKVKGYKRSRPLK